MRSLRAQLLVSHLALVVLMALVTGSAISSLRSIQHTLGRGISGNSRASRGAELVDSALVEQRTVLWLLLAGSPVPAHATYDESWKAFESGISQTKTEGVNPEVSDLAARLEAMASEYRSLSVRVMAANSLTLQPATRSVVVEVLEPRIVAMRSVAINLADVARTASSDAATAARDATDSAIARAAWVTVIGIFVAVGLGARLIRTAVAPLAELAERVENIASGDLDPREPGMRHDEIGALSDAFESMASKIREARDLARLRLRRAQQMSDAALEHLYDPVVVLDQKSRIVHLNHAAENLLGGIPDGAKVPVKEHISDRRLAHSLEVASASQSVSESEDETALIGLEANGKRKTYRIRANPMKDEEGVALGSVAILEDVTHLKEVDRLKNEFIGVASHELRTPVSSLLLSAQLLMDGAVGELTPEQKEIVDVQLQDLERLEKLMRDLLDVTKLAAGMKPPKVSKVEVEELLQTSYKTLKSQAAQKGVRLEVVSSPDSGIVMADRTQIGRVFTNLIANAIRHTSSDGVVKIGARPTSNEVTFFVEDTGEGIPPDYLARIFDRFVQVPGATQGGAGLGLSIAQNIVRAHHGRMGVESQVGRGSVFSFSLPRRPDPEGKENSA